MQLQAGGWQCGNATISRQRRGGGCAALGGGVMWGRNAEAAVWAGVSRFGEYRNGNAVSSEQVRNRQPHCSVV